MPALRPRPSLSRPIAPLGLPIAAILLAILLLAMPGIHAAAQTPFATPEASPATLANDPRLAGIKPEQQAWVAARLPDHLTTYTIAAELNTTGRTITGTVTVDYVNATGKPLDAVPFRLYANGSEMDRIVVDDVTAGGHPARTTLTVDNSVLTVPLPEPLAPQAITTIAMAFTVTMPVDSADQYGMLNIDSDTGTWAMAGWYPIVAGWDPANGFELDPPSTNGDPVFSTVSRYHLTVTAPASWTVVSTGAPADTTATSNGTRTWSIEAGPVRDVTLVADEDFQSVSEVVDGTTVTSWFNPGSDRSGKAALTYAAQAIAQFNDLLVPYPYTTFDLVPVELYGAAGVEFPQLIYVAQGYYGPDENLETPNDFDFTIAHEVVHQWFYGIVGNNQYLHAFTDEGITNFLSSRLYFSHQYGDAFGGRMFDSAARSVFIGVALAGQDQIVDTPTDDFETSYAYAWAAYSKAPVGFNAIYEQIGEDAFLRGLQDYINAFAFGVAQPVDMLDAFSTASGQDLAPLWRHWFEEKHAADDAPAMDR